MSDSISYQGYTIKIFFDHECQLYLYDIYHPSQTLRVAIDYVGSDSENETLQAAKNRIDYELVTK